MPTSEVRSPNRILSERMQFVSSAILGLFVAGWISWFYPFNGLLDRSGTPLGADFSMFYVAGQVVADGDGRLLYDQAAHQTRLHQLFPGIDPSFALPYRYPPFVAAVMAPLATLPYAVAFALFSIASCGAWWLAARQLVRCSPELNATWRKSLRWAMIGWPVALETLIGGQASMFALLIAVGVYVLVRHQSIVLAGAVLALAAYKPNVLSLLALACLIRYPRMLLGFLPVAAGVALLCWVPDGMDGLFAYRELTTTLATDSWDVATPLWKVHGLAPWFNLLLDNEGRLVCTMAGVAIVLGLALRARMTQPSQTIEPLWFASLITVNALFNAYTPIYDLVLLSGAAILTAEHLATQFGPNVARRLVAAHLLIGVVYFGPHLSQVVAKSTGAQPFSLILAAIATWQVYLLWQSQRDPSTSSDQLLTSVSG